MIRRSFLHLSLMAAGGVRAWSAPRDKGKVASKKGLGIGDQTGQRDNILKELGCSWFYNWRPVLPGGIPRGIEFVPMIKSYDKGNPGVIDRARESAKDSKCDALLGFNEPDRKNQGDMTVEQALAAWPLLEKTRLRLGSPVCVHPDNEWMQAFMKAADKQKLKVDFVCVHNYGGPDPDNFLRMLEKTHQLYKKPIWITEFAVGDWQAPTADRNRHKPGDIVKFMEKLLPKLDRLDYVERYAWFPAKQDSPPLGTSALFDNAGKLTRLGECYRDA